MRCLRLNICSAVMIAVGLLFAAPRPGSAQSPDLIVNSFGGSSPEILRYDGLTGDFLNIFVGPGSGGLFRPHGLITGPDGNLYVSDFYNNMVLRYDGTTGSFIDTFVSNGSGGLTHPCALAFGPDGSLYVNSSGTSSVLQFDGTNGAFLSTFASGGGLSTPNGLVFGPDGNLYVAGGAIVRYDGKTGAFLDDFVPAGSGGLVSPCGLNFGPDGNLYVPDFASDAVFAYDGVSGAFLRIFAAGYGLYNPHSILTGPDGDLYLSVYGDSSVRRYDVATGAYLGDFIPPGGGGLNTPTYLIFRPVDLVALMPRANPISATLTSTGIVSLDGFGPVGGAIVSLSSSNPAVASVPANAVVTAGGPIAAFPISAGTVTKDTPVTISATYAGTTLTTTVVVTRVALTAFKIQPSSVQGGSAARGILTLSRKTKQDAVVTLTSSSQDATVPTTVTIPAGGKSAKFTVQTAKVLSTTPVSITASFGGTTLVANLIIKE